MFPSSQSGGMSLDALRDNALQILLPFVGAVCEAVFVDVVNTSRKEAVITRFYIDLFSECFQGALIGSAFTALVEGDRHGLSKAADITGILSAAICCL